MHPGWTSLRTLTLLRRPRKGERSKARRHALVYAGWTHEHVTDEERRQRTIWGYIMVLSSRHNAVDIENTTENTQNV